MEKIIVYDERKRQANIVKHGYDFADLTFDFFLNSIAVQAHTGRYAAIGPFKDGVITTIFVELGSEGLSVISMRAASKKERLTYESNS